MSKITEKICSAFESRRTLKIDNSETDGTSLWLFGNKIAQWTENGISITNAGWSSKTTKDRLNGLTGVSIVQKKGQWYLNGHRWDGEWICLNDLSLLEEQENQVEFDTTIEWNRNYSKPVYSVFHTHVEQELQHVEQLLKVLGIPTRRMYSDTQGEYLPNHFVVVGTADFERAKTFMNKVSLETLQN